MPTEPADIFASLTGVRASLSIGDTIIGRTVGAVVRRETDAGITLNSPSCAVIFSPLAGESYLTVMTAGTERKRTRWQRLLRRPVEYDPHPELAIHLSNLTTGEHVSLSGSGIALSPDESDGPIRVGRFFLLERPLDSAQVVGLATAGATDAN